MTGQAGRTILPTGQEGERHCSSSAFGLYSDITALPVVLFCPWKSLPLQSPSLRSCLLHTAVFCSCGVCR